MIYTASTMGASFAKVFELCFSFEAIDDCLEAGYTKYKTRYLANTSPRSKDISVSDKSTSFTFADSNVMSYNTGDCVHSIAINQNSSGHLINRHKYKAREPVSQIYIPKPPEIELYNNSISIRTPSNTILIEQHDTPPNSPSSDLCMEHNAADLFNQKASDIYMLDTDPEDFDYGVIVQDLTSDDSISDDYFEVV